MNSARSNYISTDIDRSVNYRHSGTGEQQDSQRCAPEDYAETGTVSQSSDGQLNSSILLDESVACASALDIQEARFRYERIGWWLALMVLNMC